MNFSNYTILLKAAIAVVVFLFGTFSGFLLKFSPPDPSDELSLPIGIAQFVALALLLFVSLLCNYQATRKKSDQKRFVRLWLWISGALIILFVISSLVYYNNFRSKTVKQGEWGLRLIRGNELTDNSKAVCNEKGYSLLNNQCELFLLNKYYNVNEIINKHELWTEQSVNFNKSALLLNYILVIAGISGLLFSLVELLSWSMFAQKTPARGTLMTRI
jgi:hypothetical protein